MANEEVAKKLENFLDNSKNVIINRQFIKPVAEFCSLDIKISDKLTDDKKNVIGRYLSFIFRRKNGKESYAKDFNDKKNYMIIGLTDQEVDVFSFLIENFCDKKIIKGKEELDAFQKFMADSYEKVEVKEDEKTKMLTIEKDFMHRNDEKNYKSMKVKLQFKNVGSYYSYTGMFVSISGSANGEKVDFMGTVLNVFETYGILNNIKKNYY